MQARIRTTMEKRAKGEKGFTLIELLVVIVIIGILAAIAIPSFLNQRQKGWVAQAQADLKNAAIAAESYAVDNNGSYLNVTEGNTAATTELVDYGFTGTNGVTIDVTSATATAYTVTATHTSLPAATDTYTYTSTTGKITGPTAG